MLTRQTKEAMSTLYHRVRELDHISSDIVRVTVDDDPTTGDRQTDKRKA
jgi:4-hydroxy-3-methylbut-2-en-1-yl diphosphate synthase IspG/GcpE